MSRSCVASTGHHVYVAYDALTDECLYVGQTGAFRARMRQHEAKSPWMVDGPLVRIETEACSSAAQALWLEAVLIRALNPVHNKAGKNPALEAWREDCRQQAAEYEPPSRLLCDCAEPDADPARDFGMCQVCKRKPLELMAVAS